MLTIVGRLMDLKCDLVIMSHYIEDTGQTIEGQRPKSGTGIIPMFGGSLREELPTRFNDVVFLDVEKDGRRVFKINPQGVWGVGCRAIDGTHVIDADFGKFMKLDGAPNGSGGAKK